jgi:hypothetical protein
MNSVGGVIGLPITNHVSPITSHGRASGPAVRFEDLFLGFITIVLVLVVVLESVCYQQRLAKLRESIFPELHLR